MLEYCSLLNLLLFAFVLLGPYLFCCLKKKRQNPLYYFRFFSFWVLSNRTSKAQRELETSFSSIIKCHWERRTILYYDPRKVLLNARDMGKTDFSLQSLYKSLAYNFGNFLYKALLLCQVYTMKLTCFKCVAHWLLSTEWTFSNPSRSLEHFCPREKLCVLVWFLLQLEATNNLFSVYTFYFHEHFI